MAYATICDLQLRHYDIKYVFFIDVCDFSIFKSAEAATWILYLSNFPCQEWALHRSLNKLSTFGEGSSNVREMASTF